MVKDIAKMHAYNARSKLEEGTAPYGSMGPLGSSSSRNRRFQLVQPAEVYVGIPIAKEVR
jgi:hypothetical protein